MGLSIIYCIVFNLISVDVNVLAAEDNSVPEILSIIIVFFLLANIKTIATSIGV